MNAIQQARDALNSLNPSASKAKKSSSWEGVLNAATGGASRPQAFDLNAAKSRAADAVKQSFRDAMDRLTATTTKSSTPPTAEDVKLRKTAETLVNKMFVGTMLKSMRASPFKDATMSGGKAGDAYAGLFDQNLAEHAGGGIGTKLVDTLVKQFKTSRGDPTQLHVDPNRDVKKSADVTKTKRVDHDAIAVDLAA